MRSRASEIVFTYDGLTIRRVPNATVTVFYAGTGTAYSGTLWKNATGATGPDQYPNPFTTDIDGVILFYIDTNAPLKIVATGSGLGTLTLDYFYPTPHPNDIPSAGKAGVIYLMDYAGGFAIDGGAVSADAAWAAADADSLATGRRTIIVPDGTFLTKYAPSDGITIQGAGRGRTILKHQNGNTSSAYRSSVIYAVGRTGVTVKDLSVDGNFAQNNDSATGWASSEVSLDGTRNRAINVEVYDFNHTGFGYGGDSNRLYDCDAYRNSPPTTYPDTTDHNYGGVYGFNASSFTVNQDLVLMNCRAWNCRSAGIIFGGLRPKIINPTMYGNHRGIFPQTGGTGAPGGQIAAAYSWTGVAPNDGVTNVVGVRQGQIVAPNIGPTTVGSYAWGLELTDCAGVEVIGPEVAGCLGYAIKLLTSTDVSIVGGTLDGANPGGTANGNGGIQVNASSCRVTGTNIKNMTGGTSPVAVQLLGAGGEMSFTGMAFKGNTTNWLDTSTGSTLVSLGHRITGTGGAVPERTLQSLTLAAGELTVNRSIAADWAAVFQNLHAHGYGLDVAAGSAVGDFIARMRSFDGSLTALLIRGNGQVEHHSTTGNVAILDTTAAAAVNALLTLQRSGSTKASLGLDAADSPSILDAAGAALLTVDKTTGLFTGGGWPSADITTMTVEQPTGNAVVCTKNWARYFVLGKLVVAIFDLTYASGTATAGPIYVKPGAGCPAPLRNGLIASFGSGVIYDSSAVTFAQGTWVWSSATDLNMVINGAAGNYAGASPTAFTLSSGDRISGMVAYEIV